MRKELAAIAVIVGVAACGGKSEAEREEERRAAEREERRAEREAEREAEESAEADCASALYTTLADHMNGDPGAIIYTYGTESAVARWFGIGGPGEGGSGFTSAVQSEQLRHGTDAAELLLFEYAVDACEEEDIREEVVGY